MRTLTAREAGRYVGRLDRIAHELEHNYEDLGLTRKQALDFAFEVDKIAEEVEEQAKSDFIEEKKKEAATLKSDGDEPYMRDHFDANVNEHDADEAYMGMFSNQPGRPASDSQDQVADRTEAPVQGISEYSDGFKKQPSQPNVGGSPFPEARTASQLFEGGRYRRQTR